MTDERETQTVKVWDWPTRLFHWALVVLVALQYASGEFNLLSMDWHFRLGYATLALIVFRVLWGFAGSDTSRFATFVRGPATLFRYLAASVRGRETRSLGHNPLGGWSVLAMLLALGVQTVTGLFASDDISESGPLTGRVSDATVAFMTRIHKIDRYVLIVLITLHIAAVLLHWVIKDDNLIAPMLHGRKRITNASTPRFAGTWRGLVLFAISAVIVWMVVCRGGAPL